MPPTTTAEPLAPATGEPPPAPEADQARPGGPEAATGDHRRRRILVRVVLIALIAAVLAFEINIVTGPSVSDAPALVVAIDRAHGSLPLMIAPNELIAIALVAAEDGSFYTNSGVDVVALGRGLLGFLSGSDAGGSTIEIQLAHLLYPSATGGLWGRVHRVTLALQFDAHYTKEAILSMYLGAAYFGHGYYGVSAASEGYFGVAPTQLSWAQAALLAGLVQAPSALDPRVHLRAAMRRMGYVLDRLVSEGAMTQAQATVIARSPLGLVTPAASPQSIGVR